MILGLDRLQSCEIGFNLFWLLPSLVIIGFIREGLREAFDVFLNFYFYSFPQREN